MGRGGPRAGSGRKPKPVSQHIEDGTFRPDRHGAAEESPQLTSATRGLKWRMPAGLSPRQQTAWKTIVRDLEASSLLDRADAGMIEAAAVAWGLAGDARAAVNKHGLLVPGQREGSLVTNPAIKIQHDAWAQFRSVAVQLGLSLAARGTLGLSLARGSGQGAPEPGHAGGDEIGESPRARVLRLAG
jgi:P27 family predicted phage terminase small subunit